MRARKKRNACRSDGLTDAERWKDSMRELLLPGGQCRSHAYACRNSACQDYRSRERERERDGRGSRHKTTKRTGGCALSLREHCSSSMPRIAIVTCAYVVLFFPETTPLCSELTLRLQEAADFSLSLKKSEVVDDACQPGHISPATNPEPMLG